MSEFPLLPLSDYFVVISNWNDGTAPTKVWKSEEMTGKINNLSGGSKAKLILMKLVLDKCNVLVLDEPTRNVSPLSNPVIRKVLKDFKGTIISVSHDRKFIEEVANKLYILTNNGLNLIEKEIL